MEKFDIYKEIAQRANGNIYIGVVGPVRTGKSTLIKQVMENFVLPNIEDPNELARTRDEMPQSASGRMIMTTEPKFIPNEAVQIKVGDNAQFNIRMIDCVGYIVESALGHMEDEIPRMVNTPWFDHQIPFNEAAEIGTKKVIVDHSTIGIMVTTDGSIGEIDRADYVDAEERVVAELKNINKPFIIVLNSTDPDGDTAQRLKGQLENKYQVPVLALDCLDLTKTDISQMMEKVLFEFPVREIGIIMPGWINGLSPDHWLKKSIYDSIITSAGNVSKIRQVRGMSDALGQNEFLDSAAIDGIDLGVGSAVIELKMPNSMFYKILCEETSVDISDEQQLFDFVSSSAKMKKEYDKYANAIASVKATGYGIVSPDISEMRLETPEIVKQGGKFGVKLKASSPSIHMIRADIETEICPIVGSEKQSEELIHYLLSSFEGEPEKIWESNIFGKSLHELVNEGLHAKLEKMPVDARMKFQETLQQLINEGSGGLICIIL